MVFDRKKASAKMSMRGWFKFKISESFESESHFEQVKQASRLIIEG